MFTSKARDRALTAVTVLVVLAGAAYAVIVFTGTLDSEDAEPHVFSSVVYDPPESIPDFELTAHTGEPISPDDFDGEVVAIYFGYTHCPDVCPLTLSNFARAKAELPEEVRDDLQVLMLTVDPERDTVEALGGYVPHFDEAFLGLSGTPAEVREALEDLRIQVEFEEADDEGNYLVSHSSFTLILDREGRQRLKMNHFMTVEQIAADLRALLNEG